MLQFLIFALSHFRILIFSHSHITFCPRAVGLHEPRGERDRGLPDRAHADAGDAGGLCDHQPSTLYQLPSTNYHLSALDLPRIGATAHRGGFRDAASAAGREEGDCRGGEGDGPFAQAGGEGPLHEGGERGLLREILRRAPHLSRQAGRIRRNHPRRAQSVRTMKTKDHRDEVSGRFCRISGTLAERGGEGSELVDRVVLIGGGTSRKFCKGTWENCQ